jgi:uncharacterized protein
VHPERYVVVEQMAKDVQATLEDLISKTELRRLIDRKKYINESVGAFTIEDILKELEKPGRDPRAQIEEFRFDESIKTIDDVKVGMTVPGIVTNITNFGAFVDIGVKQDGLVHVSQLANKFVSDPNELVKLTQKVLVTVTEVDVTRRRIALTMRDNHPLKQGAKSSKLDRKEAKKLRQPLDPFQTKLMDLKKKFTN